MVSKRSIKKFKPGRIERILPGVIYGKREFGKMKRRSISGVHQERRQMNNQAFTKKIIHILRDFYGDDSEVILCRLKGRFRCMSNAIGICIKNVENKPIPLICIDRIYRQYKWRHLDLDECIGHIIEIREEYERKGKITKYREEICGWIEDIKSQEEFS